MKNRESLKTFLCGLFCGYVKMNVFENPSPGQSKGAFCKSINSLHLHKSIFPILTGSNKMLCVKEASQEHFHESGSMTLEATVLLPIIILSFLTICTAFDAMKVRTDVQIELMNQGKMAAVASTGILEDINLSKTSIVNPLMNAFGFKGLLIQNNYYTRSFSGYDLSNVSADTVTVYLAEYGEVYHQSIDCSYISLSVQAVNNPDGLKNVDGEKYLPCRNCAKGKTGEEAYITDYGEYFHYDRNCYAIKRSIYSLTREEAEKEFRECHRCVKEEING